MKLMIWIQPKSSIVSSVSEANINHSVRNRTCIVVTNLEDRLSGEKDPSCMWFRVLLGRKAPKVRALVLTMI